MGAITSKTDVKNPETSKEVIKESKKEKFEYDCVEEEGEVRHEGEEEDAVKTLDEDLSDAKDTKKEDIPKALDIVIIIKSVYSTGLLIFCVVTILRLISHRQTNLSDSVHPVFAFVVLIGSISWLSVIEGGQASLVGLSPVNKELYRHTHAKAYKSTSVTNKGDNLQRYLIGRQFMVVLVIFCVNMSAGPIEGGVDIWGFPEWLKDILFSGGLAMTLITCMIGQLNSQVNASHCMLDYIDNYFALLTLWAAMAIEFSGLLHSSYLVATLVGFLARQQVKSNEEPRNRVQNAFFWSRCLFSLGILSLCIYVTLVALFAGKTTMWESVPPGVAVVVFFILMCILGMLEGMQVAFFAVAKLKKNERSSSFFAKKTCDLLYSGDGNNLPAFMIGRQLCVVSCMLFVARVTSVDMKGDANLFGVPNAVQSLLDTGLLGALLLTILGSISWQLVASAFPIAFLSNPVTYVLLRFCLILEGTGLCQGAWVLAAIHRNFAGFQRDEVYIGTAEERTKLDVKDTFRTPSSSKLEKLPSSCKNTPKSSEWLMKKDDFVEDNITEIASEMEIV